MIKQLSNSAKPHQVQECEHYSFWEKYYAIHNHLYYNQKDKIRFLFGKG